MDLQLDTLKLPAWNPEMAGEWDEAFEKTDNYLRACRVGSRLHRARLVGLILERALNKRAANPAAASQSLATVAIDEAHALVENWVMFHLPAPEGERPYTLTEGFMALYLCDVPARWPSAFLNLQQDLPEFTKAVRDKMVQTGPELQLSSMVPQAMDRGFLPEIAEALETLEQIPVINLALESLEQPVLKSVMTLLFWGLIVVALLVIFVFSHFPDLLNLFK